MKFPYLSEELGDGIEGAGGGGEELPVGDTGKKLIDQLRSQAKASERQLKELQKKYADFTPEEILELRKAKEEQEQLDLERKKNYDEALMTAKQKAAQERELLLKERDTYRASFENTVIEASVVEAFFDADGKRGAGGKDGSKAYARLLLPQVRNQLAVIDGEVTVVDWDKDGEPVPRFNPETGKDYTLNDLMAECRKGPMAIFFEPADRASGTGATGSNSRRLKSDAYKQLEGLHGMDKLTKAQELGLV